MKRLCGAVRIRRFVLSCILFCLLCMAGCGGSASLAAQQREKFEKSGMQTSQSNNTDALARMRVSSSTYRVVPGDVLEFQMPAVLRAGSSNLSSMFEKPEPYLCRVSDAGTIAMPIIGEINVSGKTLTEVESTVADSYFPKYVVTRPAVVCKVTDYRNQGVFTVIGLVKRPDTFQYPPNVEYNLMEALALAGGVDMVADPHYVKVYRQDANGDIVSAVFRIDNPSFNEACNVEIKPGDVVSVEQTLRTRINTFLASVLHIGIGTDVRYYGR